jgi:tetratricopeptide (TPR) repeat protein
MFVASSIGFRWPALAALLILLALARSATAVDGEAKRQYEQGSAAYDVADFQEAADHFKAAYKLSKQPVLLFNIAQCYRQLKNAEQAKFFYRSYLRNAAAGDASRPDAERWLRVLDGPGEQAPATAPPTRPAVTPPPAAAPSTPCGLTPAALTFERSMEDFEVSTDIVSGFKRLSLDRSHHFCTAGALRIEATFDLTGERNQLGLLRNQGGQIVRKLSRHVDLTNKTVSAHLYVDTPSAKAEFGALIIAVNKGVGVDGKFVPALKPGKWWTITAKFGAENKLYVGGTSRVDDVDAIIVQVQALGPTPQRTWSGAIYVDDIDWQ